MLKSKHIIFLILAGWMIFASADQEKLPEEFFSKAELFSKIDMIEQLTVLENISDKDMTMAQQSDSPESKEGDTP